MFNICLMWYIYRYTWQVLVVFMVAWLVDDDNLLLLLILLPEGMTFIDSCVIITVAILMIILLMDFGLYAIIFLLCDLQSMTYYYIYFYYKR
jgi:hypothetical protein